VEAVAHAEDIKKLRSLMDEVYDLENQLNDSQMELSKKIQIKVGEGYHVVVVLVVVNDCWYVWMVGCHECGVCFVTGGI